MLFEIDFNKDGLGTDEQLIELGAVWNPELEYFCIEMITAEDFIQLAIDIDKLFGNYHYTYIVGYDTPQHGYIFIDKDI